jgi:hypothetical protein
LPAAHTQPTPGREENTCVESQQLHIVGPPTDIIRLVCWLTSVTRADAAAAADAVELGHLLQASSPERVLYHPSAQGTHAFRILLSSIPATHPTATKLRFPPTVTFVKRRAVMLGAAANGTVTSVGNVLNLQTDAPAPELVPTDRRGFTPAAATTADKRRTSAAAAETL